MLRFLAEDLKNEKGLLQSSLRVALAVAISFFICQIDLSYLDSLSLDYRIRFKPASPKSGYLSLISIDQATLESLQREPNANDHLQLLRVIGPANPKAIFYVNDLAEIAGSYDELEDFAKFAKNVPVIAASDESPPKGMEHTLVLPPPLETINVVTAPSTRDNLTFAKDSVTRRAIFSVYDRWTPHAKLASEINGLRKKSDYQGLFHWFDSDQVLIDFRPSGSYPKLSFKDVLAKNVPLERFKDRIVLIGRETDTRPEDYVLTPHSRAPQAMSKLELHANMFDTLILNRALIQAPFWLDLLFTTLICVLTVFVVLSLRPGKGLLILLVTMAAFIASSYLTLAGFHLVIGMAHPLLAIFICYYFFIPYRLIMENRRSWEYYQRNQLLMQVEELKSNFLRMMSHDLKTPLARIQGMADVVLKGENPLSPQQEEAILTINKSSEELSDFIGSILSLGRIESKDIKLQLRSKDVNTLLTEVIRKCDFLARSKNITIIPEFEPLFSMRMDEDLMRQVFTNLVENAIKYSPEGSKIMVSTEEIDGRVIVQVADQGIGIPREEIPNVFDKFFRSRTVVSSDIKGSGLGLYLCQYFVNLHKGRISVESELNKGSTFTVELPMEQEA